jgi:hypothetical protein
MPSNEQTHTPDFQSALERRLPSDLALDATLCPFSDAHSQHNNTRGSTAGGARTYIQEFSPLKPELMKLGLGEECAFSICSNSCEIFSNIVWWDGAKYLLLIGGHG